MAPTIDYGGGNFSQQLLIHLLKNLVQISFL